MRLNLAHWGSWDTVTIVLNDLYCDFLAPTFKSLTGVV